MIFFSIVVGKITLSYSFCTKYDIYRLLDFQYIQKCNDFKDVCTHILLCDIHSYINILNIYYIDICYKIVLTVL